MLTRLLTMLSVAAVSCCAQIAIRGERIHTMAGAPISDGVVLIREGKIERVGPASQVAIPGGYRTLRAAVVTPGLVDAHTVLGLSGYLNLPQDQEQVDRSAAAQPELRAIDAYDPAEPLIEYARGYGVTTAHTGHGPGVLMSGQTMVVKTSGRTVEEAVMVPLAMLPVTLGESVIDKTGKAPGRRAKAVAMLRAELIRAREYEKKTGNFARDLRLETLARVLQGELPLLVTVYRAKDILAAIRVGREFNIKMVLDGAGEAYLVTSEIKASGYPVIVHPTMQHIPGSDGRNMTFENAASLKNAGIPFALQSGYDAYVPKTRVILFEAAVAAANGLGFESAMASITIGAARIIGVDRRVGSLEPGKDGDVALFDGDPFELTTHCVGVVSDGRVVVSQQA